MKIVLENAVDLTKAIGPGIYILIRGETVVYVGQSRNPLRRIGAHSEYVVYDRVLFIPCKAEELLVKEQELIQELNPRLNRNTARPTLSPRNTVLRSPRHASAKRVEYVDPPTKFKITVSGVELELKRRSHA